MNLPDAGRCIPRLTSVFSHRYATFHDRAPFGFSRCANCRRLVVRGLGRWWER